MSETKASLQDLRNALEPSESTKALVAKRQELSEKRFAVEKHRIELQHQLLIEKKKELESIEKIQIGVLDEDYYERMGVSNDEYMEFAKNAPMFLTKSFIGIVPFFARNLIFVGAKTGQGKSTLAANLSALTLEQGKSVLMITNEEVVTDVFNRILCLFKGWFYTNHDKFTEEQRKYFRENYRNLGNRLTVIDDSWSKMGGATTTLEGIQAILKKIKESPIKYDVIIIDYFQNVSSSTNNPSMDKYKVLDKVAEELDRFKNVYNAPIVVLSQLKSDESVMFQDRIEGRKSILTKVTCALEMISHYEHGTTEFKVHKSRFTAKQNSSIHVVFNRGKFEYLDNEKFEQSKFDKEVEARKEKSDRYLSERSS